MKSSGLAKLFSIYDLALIDTSSLMEDSFPAFMDVLSSSKDYWQEGFKVVLLGDCLDELEKHSKDKTEHLKAIAAKRALKIVKHDKKKKKTFEIRKSLRNDGFADAALMSVATAEHIHSKLLVITQDKNLTKDLLNLNNLESQRGRWLKVYRLDMQANLIESTGIVPNRNEIVSPTRSDAPKYGETKPASSLANDALRKDKILNASLSNKNYPDEKKRLDIQSQLNLLSRLDKKERAKLNLYWGEDRLKEELSKLKKAPAPSFRKEEPQKPKTPQPVEVSKPVAKEPRPLAYVGPTYQMAYSNLARSKGWILRDSSVPYVAVVHGPYDISSGDMAMLEALGPKTVGESKELEIKGLLLLAKKEANGCSLSVIEGKKPTIVTPKPPLIKEKDPVVPKAEEVKKPVKRTVAKKAASDKKEEEPKPAKAKTPAKKKAVEEAPKESSPSVNLIVAEPEAKPAAKRTRAKAAKKEETAEPAITPEPKKPATKRVTKTKPAAEDKPKATRKAKTEPKETVSLAEVQKIDRELNANLNNPNYPKSRALDDINAQLLRLQSVSAEDKKDLLLSQTDLENRAKALKAEKTGGKKAS